MCFLLLLDSLADFKCFSAFLFFYVFYMFVQVFKKTTKSMQNKTPTPLEEQGCDYTVLRLVPVTIGRANSTKSSIRTGQAPGKVREILWLHTFGCYWRSTDIHLCSNPITTSTRPLPLLNPVLCLDLTSPVVSCSQLFFLILSILMKYCHII